MTSLTFPLVSLPKETIPDSSARTAASFGVLASNKSATLGSPPVISLVLDPSSGILAITSPAVIFWPSSRFNNAEAGKAYVNGWLFSGCVNCFPLPSVRLTDGTKSLPAEGLSEPSITSILLNPVNSSVDALTDTPSSISPNFTFPEASEIIGRVYGSHVAIFCPSSTLALLATNKVEP